MEKAVCQKSPSGIICSSEEVETISCPLIGEWLSKWWEYILPFLCTCNNMKILTVTLNKKSE